MELQERLRAVRKHFKLTQSEFGARLDISRSVVNNWERGVVVPPGTTYKAISSVFSINEEWLRTGEGEMLAQTNDDIIEEVARKFGADDLDKKILEVFLRLPPEQRKAFSVFATELADKINPDDEKVDK